MGSVSADIGLPLSGAIMSGLVNYKGWLLGGKMEMDVGNKKMENTSLCFGYNDANTEMLATLSNKGNYVGGMFYRKVDNLLEVGANIGRDINTGKGEVEIGGRYYIGDGGRIGLKVNNKNEVGVGVRQAVREGISVTMSGLVKMDQLDQGGHKVGMGIEFEN